MEFYKSFSQRVLEAALSIPKGHVATYGDIARVCGSGGQAARSISAILARAARNGTENIPFHRIVYANGRVYKKMVHDAMRMKRYAQEGIIVDKKGYIENFASIRYRF